MISRKMRLSRAHFAPSGPEKRASSTHFSLSFRPVETGTGGCAVVVSKKVAKLAVSRHLLKRRIYTALRTECSPDNALIVYTRSGAASLPYAELQEELSDLLTRVNG